MRIYLDSSAIIKRVVLEAHSHEFVSWLDEQHEAREVLVSSSLAWIEVTRALRTRMNAGFADVAEQAEGALSGVAEYPVAAEVVSMARRVSPSMLRSLDAIHLASALLLDADRVVTYDDRLAEVCATNGLTVYAPGT